MRFKAIAAVSLTGGLLIAGAAPSWAQTAPAPPSSADAVAVDVEDAVTVATTSADATPDPATSTARGSALDVGDDELLDDTESTQTGEGEQNNTFIEVGDDDETSVDVAPSSASVRREGETNRSSAGAALLRLVLIDPGFLVIDVLTSFSEASYTGSNSRGSGSSDGVFTRVGDETEIVILHSDASTENGGSSYVARIEDTEIITDEDVEGTAEIIDIEDVLRINAVSVDGGPGADLVRAAAVDAEVGDEITAVVNGVSATGATGQAAAPAPPPAELPAGDTGGGGGGGSLPRTGLAIGGLLLLGTGLIGSGALVARAMRRSGIGSA